MLTILNRQNGAFSNCVQNTIKKENYLSQRKLVVSRLKRPTAGRHACMTVEVTHAWHQANNTLKLIYVKPVPAIDQSNFVNCVTINLCFSRRCILCPLQSSMCSRRILFRRSLCPLLPLQEYSRAPAVTYHKLHQAEWPGMLPKSFFFDWLCRWLRFAGGCLSCLSLDWFSALVSSIDLVAADRLRFPFFGDWTGSCAAAFLPAVVLNLFEGAASPVCFVAEVATGTTPSVFLKCALFIVLLFRQHCECVLICVQWCLCIFVDVCFGRCYLWKGRLFPLFGCACTLRRCHFWITCV